MINRILLSRLLLLHRILLSASAKQKPGDNRKASQNKPFLFQSLLSSANLILTVMLCFIQKLIGNLEELLSIHTIWAALEHAAAE